jgi:hypothetical protein
MSYSLNTIGSNFIVKNGTIGIGIDATSNYKLHLSCNVTNMTADIFPLKISGGPASNISGRGVFMGLGTQNLDYVKCAIGHVRMSSNDIGDIVFLNRATNDNVSCSMANEIMRVTNSNVGIMKSSTGSSYSLDVGGNINASGFFLNGQSFGELGSTGWFKTTTTVYTSSNVTIGSNVNAVDKLEVYGGDIDVINGIMKRTQLNVTVLGTFTPHIWYQFNEDPTRSTTLTDSGYSDIKYDMTITKSGTKITKITGYSTGSYQYPNAYQFNAVNNSTDNIKNTTSANLQTLLNNIYSSKAFSINFVFYINANNAFTVFKLSNSTYNFIVITYDNSSTSLKFRVNENSGTNLEASTAIALTTTYNIQCVFTYATDGTMKVDIYKLTYPNTSTSSTVSQISASAKFGVFQNASLSSLIMELGSGTTSTDVRVQDLRIFLYALNADERTALQTGRPTWNNSNINFVENYGIERWKDSSTYNKLTGKNFIYYNDGNVGIGTTNPTYNLHLHNREMAKDVRIMLSDGTTTGGSSDGFHIAKNTTSDAVLWNYESCNMIFGTSNAERMRILADGKVGIGTNNPTYNLHVHNSSTARDVRIILSDGTTGIGTADGFHIAKNTTSQGLIWNNENADMLFGTNNVERIRILADGKVGIGTNAPGSFMLNVNGSVNTGALTATSISSTGNVSITGTNTLTVGGTISEGGTLLGSKYLALAGGTLTGALTFPIDTWMKSNESGTAVDRFFFSGSASTILNTPTAGNLVFRFANSDKGFMNSGGDLYAYGVIYEGGTANTNKLSEKYQAKGSYMPTGGGTFTGQVTFPVDTWIKSSEGDLRIHFGNTSHSYYRVRNGGNHIWRILNSSGGEIDVMTLSGNPTNGAGILSVTSYISTPTIYLGQWAIYTAGTAGTNGEKDLHFYNNVNAETAKISYATSSEYLAFTGQHRNSPVHENLYDEKYIGYIVVSSGRYQSQNINYKNTSIKRNIVINDALPIVELSSISYQKNVFGIITESENTSNTSVYNNGMMKRITPTKNGDKKLIINGCGEGGIWVTNYNGILQNGDYITTSPMPGLGMKQDDDLVHNYTVAKITMDCDFNPKMIPVERVKTFVDTSNIINNAVDDMGNLIYEYELDQSSNIIYETEYDLKYVQLDGTIVDYDYYCNNSNVYKMAFVGCCYKAS